MCRVPAHTRRRGLGPRVNAPESAPKPIARMEAVWHVESYDAKMDGRGWLEKSEPVNDIKI